NAFGCQSTPGQITKRTVPERAGVPDFQALSGGRSHQVEAATALERRPGSQHVAAPPGQRRHLGDNVDDHVAEADQAGDHGPARSANSFSATRSRSKLLVSSTVRTASGGQLSMP